MKNTCIVAVNTPFNKSILTYKYEDSQNPKPGDLWSLPLGKRQTQGCILSVDTEEDGVDLENLKNLGEKKDFLRLDDEYLDFLKWVSHYYHYPLGMLIFDILPKELKKPRPLKEYSKKETSDISLSDKQIEIYNSIVNKKDASRSLIYGVTGSGKTTIYTKLINETLKKGMSALFVLPEINLTNQFIDYLTSHIEYPLYCYNSSLSNSDKFGLWKLLTENDSPKVILAVRSGIFLPIGKLGIIIVDEEHDGSFKQEDRCCYNARDLAVKISQNKNIPVVLGSATPMIETLHKYEQVDSVHKLETRFADKALPQIEIVSELEKNEDKTSWPLVGKSINLIEESLDKNEQVLILLNRLGYSNYLQCRACSHQFFCLNCSIPLRYFKKKNVLSCQTCDFQLPIPEECPDCGNMNLINIGYGTEKIKEVLSSRFPGKTIERFDRDEITTFTKLNERLDDFHAGKIDILVGTQMLSKGHNFKKVNTVLVLGIDSMLNFPDFRSTERAYQLLIQVAGRAGRFSGEGKVIVQTKSPENKIFDLAKEHDYDSFFKYEIEMRKLCSFPPYSRLIMIYLVSRFQERLISDSNIAVDLLKKIAKDVDHNNKVDILGPRPALIEKRSNKYTFCILLNSNEINTLHNLVSSFEDSFKPSSGTTIKVDIDPYHLN
jgi:primosomal protein N' (replication factor Y)